MQEHDFESRCEDASCESWILKSSLITLDISDQDMRTLHPPFTNKMIRINLPCCKHNDDMMFLCGRHALLKISGVGGRTLRMVRIIVPYCKHSKHGFEKAVGDSDPAMAPGSKRRTCEPRAFEMTWGP